MDIEKLKTSAENGNAESQCELAQTYFQLGDKQKAFYWFKKSAEQGYDDGQLALGILYLNGEGVQKDKKQAISWLKKSAEQYNPDAKAILAELGH